MAATKATAAAAAPAAQTRGDAHVARKPEVASEGTFRYQEELPKLPVPALEATCERFLATVRPLLSSEDMAETEQAVQAFLDDQGPGIQEELLAYAETQDNYVDAFWDDAYLKYLVPVVVNVNPFFVLEDDPSSARNDQIQRAAHLTLSMLKFVKAVRNETMAVDMARKTPLCMSQYRKVLGSARIPGRGDEGDRIETFTDSTHIVVMCHGQLYYFDVVTASGDLLGSVESLASTFERIRANAACVDARKAQASSVGALTGEERAVWGEVRAELEAQDENNASSLALIDAALFVVCLDNCSPTTAQETSANGLRGLSVVDAAGVQRGTVFNRWYDKLCVIVCENGSAQINFEHTPADGHSVLRMVSDVFSDNIIRYAQTISGKLAVPSVLKSVRFDAKKSTSATTQGAQDDTEYTTLPRKLDFVLDDALSQSVASAQERLVRYVEPFKIACLEYKDYGKRFIVSQKLSPDAFVQMSMMAALYAVTGELSNAYESVMTKAFLLGRTEAGRPVTPEAKRFVEMFYSIEVSPEEKLQALEQATKAHSAMTRRCSQGEGVDRHLYALKCLWALQHPDEPVPEIFSSAGYATLGETILSTSNCGNPALKLFGFGPVSEHGVGIGYIIKDQGISLTLCSKSIPVDDMKDTIEAFLDETRSYLLKTRRSGSFRPASNRVRRSGRPGTFV
ncbi:Carnitine O-palmitoyltransferase 2, mitochondrial [Hondaea fermentalgiana]|uniref:Carnitine O-palmitoyltransferase 2, mitochondrial n=1 Tax=Hondaea fermentalgiana TaxID=2315210 RepID=A0A2R5GKI7_9STRA|nr:Carnitine O-palmitoyltransferase 2, mitochondrial [Hondaea fermentalgiana]|eukprot:GBG31422.1 Carnitine O-palmitoyltransferase 2, mitochondrial [Hondaea fermentalgiana]